MNNFRINQANRAFLNKTIVYAYNVWGNITSKAEYAYTT